jgi:hypothetical protein
MAIKRKWGVTPVGPLMADSVAKAEWLLGIIEIVPYNEGVMPISAMIFGDASASGAAF